MGPDDSNSLSENCDIIAHVRMETNKPRCNPHFLIDHLNSTGDLAFKFSEKFKSGDFGKTIGLLHDLGKGRKEWQSYFRKKTGYEQEDFVEDNVSTVEHSIYGAKFAMKKYPVFGEILSYSVAGHHAGLADWSPAESGQSSLKYRLNKQLDLKSIYPQLLGGMNFPELTSPPFKFKEFLDLSLWIRMLFSSLVDADFLDTEAYMTPEKSELRTTHNKLTTLLDRFTFYMNKKEEKSEDTDVNRIRKVVRKRCVESSDKPMGVFSLTVPTGGGKTLSSLAFALNHAVKHNLERIIYVAPFTSIIEQNADVFRKAIGDENVVEHHSNITDENDDDTKLASENWDAPMIVTTSVQFFESLFAYRPSKCRKLHNIVNSVVVLDEAQILPISYMRPILETLKLLVKRYNVSIVISTATQPALKKHEIGGSTFPGFESITEIMGDNISELYDKLNRVDIHLPEKMSSPKQWEELSAELVKYPNILCIVSDRKSCRELHKIMPEGTYHLSALMCGEHRRRKIREIKEKLDNKEPVRVISTQLIEAGVDIDFPVVYRSMAGLDSIAQAAGRCNREGKNEKHGQVFVFKGPRKTPAGILRKSEDTFRNIVDEIRPNLLNPDSFEKFFTELYWKANDLDSNRIMELLPNNLSISFKTASSRFNIIDDTIQKTILVRYDRESEQLIDSVKHNGRNRTLMRKLQKYSVNIYNHEFDDLLNKGLIEEIEKGTYALSSTLNYNEEIGLVLDEVLYEPEKYILQ